MNEAFMSRYMLRAYLRLYIKISEKQNSVDEGLICCGRRNIEIA